MMHKSEILLEGRDWEVMLKWEDPVSDGIADDSKLL